MVAYRTFKIYSFSPHSYFKFINPSQVSKYALEMPVSLNLNSSSL
jgi:hypothetical protein